MKMTTKYHLTSVERSQIKAGLAAIERAVGAKWKNKQGSKVYEIVDIQEGVIVVKLLNRDKNDYGKVFWRPKTVQVNL